MQSFGCETCLLVSTGQDNLEYSSIPDARIGDATYDGNWWNGSWILPPLRTPTASSLHFVPQGNTSASLVNHLDTVTLEQNTVAVFRYSADRQQTTTVQIRHVQDFSEVYLDRFSGSGDTSDTSAAETPDGASFSLVIDTCKLEDFTSSSKTFSPPVMWHKMPLSTVQT